MVLGDLEPINNAGFEKKKIIVNDNIVLHVFIICQKLQPKHVWWSQDSVVS